MTKRFQVKLKNKSFQWYRSKLLLPFIIDKSIIWNEKQFNQGLVSSMMTEFLKERKCSNIFERPVPSDFLERYAVRRKKSRIQKQQNWFIRELLKIDTLAAFRYLLSQLWPHMGIQFRRNLFKAVAEHRFRDLKAWWTTCDGIVIPILFVEELTGLRWVYSYDSLGIDDLVRWAMEHCAENYALFIKNLKAFKKQVKRFFFTYDRFPEWSDLSGQPPDFLIFFRIYHLIWDIVNQIPLSTLDKGSLIAFLFQPRAVGSADSTMELEAKNKFLKLVSEAPNKVFNPFPEEAWKKLEGYKDRLSPQKLKVSCGPAACLEQTRESGGKNEYLSKVSSLDIDIAYDIFDPELPQIHICPRNIGTSRKIHPSSMRRRIPHYEEWEENERRLGEKGLVISPAFLIVSFCIFQINRYPKDTTDIRLHVVSEPSKARVITVPSFFYSTIMDVLAHYLKPLCAARVIASGMHQAWHMWNFCAKDIRPSNPEFRTFYQQKKADQKILALSTDLETCTDYADPVLGRYIMDQIISRFSNAKGFPTGLFKFGMKLYFSERDIIEPKSRESIGRKKRGWLMGDPFTKVLLTICQYLIYETMSLRYPYFGSIVGDDLVLMSFNKVALVDYMRCLEEYSFKISRPDTFISEKYMFYCEQLCLVPQNLSETVFSAMQERRIAPYCDYPRLRFVLNTSSDVIGRLSFSSRGKISGLGSDYRYVLDTRGEYIYKVMFEVAIACAYRLLPIEASCLGNLLPAQFGGDGGLFMFQSGTDIRTWFDPVPLPERGVVSTESRFLHQCKSEQSPYQHRSLPFPIVYPEDLAEDLLFKPKPVDPHLKERREEMRLKRHQEMEAERRETKELLRLEKKDQLDPPLVFSLKPTISTISKTVPITVEFEFMHRTILSREVFLFDWTAETLAMFDKIGQTSESMTEILNSDLEPIFDFLERIQPRVPPLGTIFTFTVPRRTLHSFSEMKIHESQVVERPMLIPQFYDEDYRKLGYRDFQRVRFSEQPARFIQIRGNVPIFTHDPDGVFPDGDTPVSDYLIDQALELFHQILRCFDFDIEETTRKLEDYLNLLIPEEEFLPKIEYGPMGFLELPAFLPKEVRLFDYSEHLTVRSFLDETGLVSVNIRGTLSDFKRRLKPILPYVSFHSSVTDSVDFRDIDLYRHHPFTISNQDFFRILTSKEMITIGEGMSSYARPIRACGCLMLTSMTQLARLLVFCYDIQRTPFWDLSYDVGFRYMPVSLERFFLEEDNQHYKIISKRDQVYFSHSIELMVPIQVPGPVLKPEIAKISEEEINRKSRKTPRYDVWKIDEILEKLIHRWGGPTEQLFSAILHRAQVNLSKNDFPKAMDGSNLLWALKNRIWDLSNYDPNEDSEDLYRRSIIQDCQLHDFDDMLLMVCFPEEMMEIPLYENLDFRMKEREKKKKKREIKLLKRHLEDVYHGRIEESEREKFQRFSSVSSPIDSDKPFNLGRKKERLLKVRRLLVHRNQLIRELNQKSNPIFLKLPGSAEYPVFHFKFKKCVLNYPIYLFQKEVSISHEPCLSEKIFPQWFTFSSNKRRRLSSRIGKLKRAGIYLLELFSDVIQSSKKLNKRRISRCRKKQLHEIDRQLGIKLIYGTGFIPPQDYTIEFYAPPGFLPDHRGMLAGLLLQSWSKSPYFAKIITIINNSGNLSSEKMLRLEFKRLSVEERNKSVRFYRQQDVNAVANDVCWRLPYYIMKFSWFRLMKNFDYYYGKWTPSTPQEIFRNFGFPTYLPGTSIELEFEFSERIEQDMEETILGYELYKRIPKDCVVRSSPLLNLFVGEVLMTPVDVLLELNILSFYRSICSKHRVPEERNTFLAQMLSKYQVRLEVPKVPLQMDKLSDFFDQITKKERSLIVDEYPIFVKREIFSCFRYLNFFFEPRVFRNWNVNLSIFDIQHLLFSYLERDIPFDPSWSQLMIVCKETPDLLFKFLIAKYRSQLSSYDPILLVSSSHDYIMSNIRAKVPQMRVTPIFVDPRIYRSHRMMELNQFISLESYKLVIDPRADTWSEDDPSFGPIVEVHLSGHGGYTYFSF
uniref:Putative replicase n=1 Tax=Cunsystermes virus TaxID=2796584 RepID=A0A894KLN1_9VIRU|nr:putative replicase [Cunsystermes virus]